MDTETKKKNFIEEVENILSVYNKTEPDKSLSSTPTEAKWELDPNIIFYPEDNYIHVCIKLTSPVYWSGPVVNIWISSPYTGIEITVSYGSGGYRKDCDEEALTTLGIGLLEAVRIRRDLKAALKRAGCDLITGE